MKNERILNELTLKKSSSRYTENLTQYNNYQDNVVIAHKHEALKFYDFHNHEFFELVFVKHGRCINMVANDNVNMSEGDIMIMHPDTFHSLYSDRTGRPINVLISVTWLNTIAERLCNLPIMSKAQEFLSEINTPNTYKYICFKTNPEQRAAAMRLVDNLLIDPLHEFIREAQLFELLCLLALDCESAVLSSERGISGGKFNRLYNYMAQNYLTVTLDELAREFSYTKSYVCRLFKQYSKKSFCESLNEIKIRKAMTLLVSSTSTVEKIAELSGINCIEYFHRLFRKQCGMTPIQYRELYKPK